MKKGFTLFEAVLAMLVFSMIIYIGSTSLLQLIPKYRLEMAVWDIRAALNSARYRALFEGVSYRIRLLGDSYAVDRFDEGHNIWVLKDRRFCEGVTIEANNAPVFTSDGAVTGLATIYVRNAWGIYKITLAITGRIKSARVS